MRVFPIQKLSFLLSGACQGAPFFGWLPPAMDELVRAFAEQYGGGGREVSGDFYTSSGCLVESEIYGEDLGFMVFLASTAPDLQQAITMAQKLDFQEDHAP